MRITWSDIYFGYIAQSDGTEGKTGWDESSGAWGTHNNSRVQKEIMWE